MLFSAHLLAALEMSLAMAWRVGWSLVFGFAISGCVQALVSKERMRARLGRDGLREIALATGYGIASSSCSYAAASMSRTLFKKGAALTPSLAFLFASTNLVVELGFILYVLMGPQFTAAEWIGGVVLIAIMATLVRLTYPRALVEAARAHVEPGAGGGDHGDDDEPDDRPLLARLRDPAIRVRIAERVASDWAMLRDDLAIGFVVAGLISVFVPSSVWNVLFLHGAPSWVRLVAGPILGVVLAMLTFVCSIGNVPTAAILWSAGMPFGGVIAFLYADLVVLPLLDVYRKYYGAAAAGYIFGIFATTMVLAAIVTDAAFSALRLVPTARPDAHATIERFSFDYTFWLNLVAAAIVGYVIFLLRNRPAKQCCR